MRVWVSAIVMVMVALLGAVALGNAADTSALQGYGSSAQPGNLADAAMMSGLVAPRAFVIRGSLSRLYPGSVKPLLLTVINPFRYAIAVTSIRTTVIAMTTQCPAGNLRVAAFRGRLRLPARHAARISVISTFSRAAPNGCQGARFVLRYRGIGWRG